MTSSTPEAPVRGASTTSHWGAYRAVTGPDGGLEIVPHPADPDPSPLLGNVASALRHPTRVARPAVRRSWLERGPGPRERRADEEFVEVGWDEALDLVAAELDRVRRVHGNQAIFGGSYGWASAGRFHHAPGQLRRFLNTVGGCTTSRNSYSLGTSLVLLPHLVGDAEQVLRRASTWPTIAAHTELIVAFGGLPGKNVHVTPGGVTRHITTGHLRALTADIALVSPIRDEAPAGARWYPLRPGTDTALMLALAHTLVSEDLHDRAFLDRCTTGFPEFARSLEGRDAEWAAPICGVPAADIRDLARRMARSRTLLTVTWSLQRTEYGEQPVWAGLALAALLGQIGLPGGGFGHGYGSMGDVGDPGPAGPAVRLPYLPQGRNPVEAFIPVARIADMLLHPGERFDYDGAVHTYPDIRLVHWAGGNPFHHHQDLNRLRRAFARPDTIVVHEPYWTATARHADVVLPATVTLEREDLGSGRRDTHVIAMHRAVEPYGEARDDYAILAALAARLGTEAQFTEGRTARQWVEHLYASWGGGPPFEEFWAAGEVELGTGPGTRTGTASPTRTGTASPTGTETGGPAPDESADDDGTLFAAFRRDPEANPLRTPSGRIELYSGTIASFGYDDCPGHPVWREPSEWRHVGRYPLHLIADQPATRLHSQLDVGAVSRAAKVAGREAIHLHPLDAAERGIAAGDVVRVFNDRGTCLAGAVLNTNLRRGVVRLPTGAWYDPLGDTCVHGNPNALTADRPSSRLSQGCTGQHALVQVERLDGDPPPVTVLEPPVLRKAAR
ncbi:molybdopterin-dependent oxidoreductase [Planobispora takensis]|uniref:Biotin transporter BioY n=1 Tax=Planobispora takensis TaxID=1367882 RepID=A0A8J3SVL2_9ACTN|nr:molybdopterin-dependent oxidoreductase [Planobispora takensis]GII01454.1 biotin transporter BioY [Planobispora takensis]